MPAIPEKPTLDGIEARWSERWERDGVYRFDRTAGRADVFSIDTPPPTVSGSIHMGTVFGYTQTDALARYRRMAGKAVFYPIGWDDNGLATERRVQNFYGVRCDPSQPYDPDFTPPYRGDAPKDHREVPISRPNFVTLCHELTATDEAVFEELFRRAGMSFDWTLQYATIDDLSRRTSQAAFLRNLARGEAYSAEAPTVWDVDDRTAVAQAEIEDRERPGAYHLIAFAGPDGDVLIDTTRPELIVSCVALVAHPDDERYADLVGSTVRTPIFGVEVPVVAHPLAQPDKGTGIAMVCTFGDTTDVTWWRELDLPTRSVIGRDGRFVAGSPAWLATDAAQTAYEPLAGQTVKQAQAAMVGLLRESGDLRGEPRPITHPVKFYERGSRPLEIVTSRQWYIRNGGRDQDRRDAFLTRGKELNWFPDHMRHRYDHWVEGLNGDWLVSRQRFFGVPIPLWYPVGDDGEPDHDRPILPAEDTLPIDPSAEAPPGFTEDQRGRPGGFVGDPDIMDTWATSSLTPQIGGHWVGRSGALRACLPDGRATAGPGDHPHLAVLDDRPLALRARHAAVGQRHAQRLDPRPGPQEDVQVQGQRRDPDAAVRAVRHGRRALLGGVGPSGGRHGGQRGPDEGRSPAGDEAAQRHQVRPRHPRRGWRPWRGRRHGPRRRGDARPSRRRAGRGHGGVRGLRLRQGARAHRVVLLVVLRRLRRAGQGARLRWSRRGPGGVGARRPADRPRDPAADARPDAALRHRGGVELVARGQHPRHALAGAGGRGPVRRSISTP